VARNILKAVERNRAVAPIAAEAWIAYAIKRISPRLAGWAARRIAAAAESRDYRATRPSPAG
jgi:hypothetical protein